MSRDEAVRVAAQEIPGPHGAIPARAYTPADPAGPGLVWLHGGGFWAGDLDMPEADWVARSFAARGITVLSVDYRLAPPMADAAGREGRSGFRHPVPVDDVVAAFRWATASEWAAGPWAIGGTSAGGNLAAAATLRLVAEGGIAPALALLAYPTLLAVQPAPDPELRAALDADPGADVFGPDAVRALYENYLDAPAEQATSSAAPGLAVGGELAGFPPVIMINAEVDELRVSGEAFARTLAEAGVPIDVSIEPGTTHGYLNRPEEAAASRSIARYAERILALG
ncbi:alpha/beta hydrolase [Microbacterium azadirachtae]|uniref:alpha/beta hydrolase n=1 Tax=Microbacterium azadirachtae TaxID=582680 RepID=UPI0021D48FF1|nr:alpha/beta hydrolase [Microbacterium azadirachtae]UXW85118.1 alpha/beta hydrolase [Microbacterium azadirachtae]